MRTAPTRRLALPLEFGAEQSIARRQATTLMVYKTLFSPAPCRPWAIGGVAPVAADAVVGEGGKDADTYRQSIDDALEGSRPGGWRGRRATWDEQGRSREGRIESRRSNSCAKCGQSRGCRSGAKKMEVNLVITRAGRHAIGVENDTAESDRSAAKETSVAAASERGSIDGAPRPCSKQALIV